MRVALLCDIGHSVYHVGNEATAIASAAQLRKRGHEVVMISHDERPEAVDPAAAATTEIIPALNFPTSLDQRDGYLTDIRKVLAGNAVALPSSDQLFALMGQLRDVDALVLGGGTLDNDHGPQLFERLATALVAAQLDVPVIMGAHSLGPSLLLTDRALLRELLTLCALVGVRDDDSLHLAAELCPDHQGIVRVPDDALSLDVDWDQPKESRIAVSVDGAPDPYPEADFVAVLASLLDELAERTGASIELIPHAADPDRPRADVRLHQLIADQLHHKATLRRIEPADDAAARLAGSAWVVTTRMHPALFGLASGSAVLPLVLTRTNRSHLAGALGAWGQENTSLPFAALWNPADGSVRDDVVKTAIDAAVSGGASVPDNAQGQRTRLLKACDDWWDRVDATLKGADPRPESPSAPFPAPTETAPHSSGQLAEAVRPFVPAPASGRDRSVAIIMRTKDRPGFLDRAVQDVLEQTLADWQLVVVNDAGDPEQVTGVLDRYRHELGDRLTVVNNPVSHGMEAASNVGLANSRSEFVNVHDDDDTWQPRFLHETTGHLRDHPDELSVATRTLLVMERRQGPDWITYESFASWPELHAMHFVDFMRLNRMVPICLLYRRAVHDRIGPYAEDYRVIGDYVFHLRLLQAGPMGFIDHPLAHWHHRPAEVRDTTNANSMYALKGDHAEYDLRIRDQALKEWTNKNGLGLPLFISRELDQSTTQLEQRLDKVTRMLTELQGQLQATEEAAREACAANVARRAVRVARGYVTRAAGRITRRR
ncbi:polysaccharide pyruvyl transferase family protein [Propionibacterium freudenreichii]|uniref:polysaccharide pyruvyl transferase family protein n=1 Tax=Propionibacterium freudenreichii TaxID=1744 RepID=UPI0038539504